MQNTFQHGRGRTTVTSRPSLFDSLLSGKDVIIDPQEEVIRADLKKQNSENNSITKSLKNLGAIFYQKKLDYIDFKISLKYNNKNLLKIALENIENFPSKAIKQLTKNNLTGLQELKFKDIPLKDEFFEIFKLNQGLSSLFPILGLFQVTGSNQLTTKFVTNCFVNTKQPQTLHHLDLSNSQIDQCALAHLSSFEWPLLTKLVVQWCNKINEFSSLAQRASNFPKLSTLDFRFTMISNDQVQKLLDSDLIYRLENIRVFGAKVEYYQCEWNTNWLLEQVCEKIDQYKIQSVSFWQAGPDTLCPLQRKWLAQIKETTYDKLKGSINCNILIDADLRIHLSWKWHITPNNVLICINENLQYQNIAVQQISHYLERKQKSIKSFDIFIDSVQLNDSSLIFIGDAISSLKELKKFSIRFTKQQSLGQKAYLYFFHEISQSLELQTLKLDLEDNNIFQHDSSPDKDFLNKLMKAVQKLSQLYNLCINLDQNHQDKLDVKEFINRIIFNEKSNLKLCNINLKFNANEQLDFKFQDLVELYFGNYLKTISINNDQNLFPKKKSIKIQEKLQELAKKKKNLQIRQIHTLQAIQLSDLRKVLRSEILEELVSFMYRY